MSASDIYDFESAVEEAVKAIFDDAGVTAWTAVGRPDETTADDAAQPLQKERPRVEIQYINGAGQRRFLPIAGDNSCTREQAWIGQIRIDAITDATVAAHRSFIATVRNVMAIIITVINGGQSQGGKPLLTHHKLQIVTDGGSSQRYKTDEGYFQTTLLYGTHLSVQQNAWPLLNQP